MYTIGIDVGGTSIKAGIVKGGEIIYKSSKVTDIEGGADRLVLDIVELVNEMIECSNIDKCHVSTIGVGIPGIVAKNGDVTCVNIHLHNVQLAKRLEQKLENFKIKVENDATVAGVAEYAYGSMKGHENGVMITFGTGIGGGIIINGKPYSGVHGLASELGHMTIATNEDYTCNCGLNGCFETFCSATAVIKKAKLLINQGRKTSILDKANGNVENVTAKDVFDSYKENDEVAIEIINKFKENLALGLANIIHALDPDIISIGGGLSNASDIILKNLPEMIKERVVFDGAGIPEIVIAQFKNDAGIIGASAL